MNKIEFIARMSDLAETMARIFDEYVEDRPQYFGKTESGDQICVLDISASIQRGTLATIGVDLGSVDSAQIKINRYPNSSDSDWSIEEKNK